MPAALLGPWLPLSSGRPHAGLLYEFSVAEMKHFFDYAFMCRLRVPVSLLANTDQWCELVNGPAGCFVFQKWQCESVSGSTSGSACLCPYEAPEGQDNTFQRPKYNRVYFGYQTPYFGWSRLKRQKLSSDRAERCLTFCLQLLSWEDIRLFFVIHC